MKGTGGFVDAHPPGALNVILPGSVRPGASPGAPPAKAHALEVRLSALERIDETLDVLDGDRVVFTTRLQLAPMETWQRTIDPPVPAERLRVRAGTWLDYRPAASDGLSRPLESPKDFDWTSAQGLWLAGREWIRQRDYRQAQAALEACLKKDPHYLAALADLAMVRYRAMDYPGGFQVGEHVKILSLRTHGVVTEVEASLKQVEVMTEKAKVMTSFSDIVKATEEEEKRVEIPKGLLQERREEKIQSQLNVIGLTVEDAVPRVDKFIDQALLHGLEGPDYPWRRLWKITRGDR